MMGSRSDVGCVGSVGFAMCVLAIVAVGCTSEQRRATTTMTRPARVHQTFTIDDNDSASITLDVRDLFTREQYILEDRRGLLVLSATVGIIDTISTPVTKAHPQITMRVIDSSFVNVGLNRDDGRSSHSDLICIADGKLTWAARLPGAWDLPAAIGGDVYNATFMILRSPRAVTGGEIFRSSHESPDVAWRHHFELRFDDSTRVFSNAMISLDSVAIEGASRLVTGRHSAIALRIGTWVLVDRSWYALTQLEDFDSLELAKGTVGLVLEGKGEWGDTLRAVR